MLVLTHWKQLWQGQHHGHAGVLRRGGSLPPVLAKRDTYQATERKLLTYPTPADSGLS